MSLVQEVESSLSNKGDVNIVVPYLNREVRRIMRADGILQHNMNGTANCTYVLNREESLKGTGKSYVINYHLPNTLADMLSESVALYDVNFFITYNGGRLETADSLDEFLAYSLNEMSEFNIDPSIQKGKNIRLGEAYAYEQIADCINRLVRTYVTLDGEESTSEEVYRMPVYTRANVIAFPDTETAKDALQVKTDNTSFKNYSEAIYVRTGVNLQTEPKSLFNHSVSDGV